MILSTINQYMPYVYILMCLVLIVFLVRYLSALIKLYKRADTFDAKLSHINEGLVVSKIKYDSIKNKVKTTFENLLKALAIINIARFIFIKKKRQEIKEAKHLNREYTKYQRSLDRLT